MELQFNRGAFHPQIVIKAKLLIFVFLLSMATIVLGQKSKKAVTNIRATGTVWSAEKAHAWYARHKWITGA
ncbi:MAG: hypothetical protein H7X88_03600, partial [Gloeobacteraceae cyanobacterium ES-bin-316]|nr:hypothetical protein [Ferruginibacter sp.]